MTTIRVRLVTQKVDVSPTRLTPTLIVFKWTIRVHSTDIGTHSKIRSHTLGTPMVRGLVEREPPDQLLNLWYVHEMPCISNDAYWDAWRKCQRCICF